MRALLLVAAGGGLGAVLRYLLAGVVQSGAGGAFPWGTLAVNLLGCLVIGLLGTLFTGPPPAREEWRLLLLVGLLGGFTTFSTFGYEALGLMLESEWGRASAYVVASNALGLLAVWLGYRTASALQTL